MIKSLFTATIGAALLFAIPQAGAGVASTANVTALNLQSIPGTPSTQSQVGGGTSSFKSNTTYTLNYSGVTNQIASFTTSTGLYEPLVYPGTITTTLVRVPGSEPNNNNIIYSRLGSTSGNTYNLSAPYFGDEQRAFNSNNINVGADNFFGNRGDGNGNNNNIERLDVVFGDGLEATSALAFTVFERGTTTGHDPFGMAAILAVDALGQPTAYGPLVRFGSGSSYGRYGTSNLVPSSTDWLVTRNLAANQGAPATNPSTVVKNQTVGGVTVAVIGSVADNGLGVARGTKIFGYSLFAGDVTGTGSQVLTNPATFPRASSSGTGDGGIDLIAYTGVAFNEVTTNPSVKLTKTGTFIPSAPAPLVANDIFGSASSFNALVFGNVTAENGDVDGTFAIGGDATINGGYAVGYVVKGHPIAQVSGGTTDRFIIAGDLADGNFGVNGNIVVGGTRTGPDREPTNGNSLRFVNPVTFDAAGNVPDDGSGTTFAELRAGFIQRSGQLADLADRGVVEKDLTLPYRADLVGNDPELNVFNVTAAEWSRTGSSINITAPAGSTVVINVSGGPIDISNSGMHLEGIDLERVLFNYADATELKTTNFAHLGSVLAPFANGDFNAGSIDGRAVIGGNFRSINGFEVHNFFFNGSVPLPSGPPTPATIVYTFEIENTGDVDLENITITDPMVTVDGGPITLAVGESDTTTFTATYFPTDAEIAAGTISNTATVNGETAGGVEQVSDSDTFVLTFPGAGGATGGAPAPASGGSAAAPGASAPLVAVPVAPGSRPFASGRAVLSVDGRQATLSGAASSINDEDQADRPALLTEGSKKRRTKASRSTIRGTAYNAALLEIKTDNASFKRVKGTPARWRIRTERLEAGRNVVKIRAIGATGASRQTKVIIIKE